MGERAGLRGLGHSLEVVHQVGLLASLPQDPVQTLNLLPPGPGDEVAQGRPSEQGRWGGERRPCPRVSAGLFLPRWGHWADVMGWGSTLRMFQVRVASRDSECPIPGGMQAQMGAQPWGGQDFFTSASSWWDEPGTAGGKVGQRQLQARRSGEAGGLGSTERAEWGLLPPSPSVTEPRSC